MPTPATGDVTFLFTDIEGSTALWDRDPEAMADALAEHDRRIRGIATTHHGSVFTTAGDSFAIAFAAPTDAVLAAIEIQLGLAEPIVGLTLRVRIGVHTGTAMLRDGDYFGGAVNRAARVAASAHGGQLIITEPVAKAADASVPPGVELLDLGTHRLRGLAEPERLYQVCHPELGREFARLRTVEGPGDTLPAQLTSFVGREREVADVLALVADHRLVTLSGSGGAGKTRLALHVAEQLVTRFPDGVRLADLAAVDDADVLADEIAQRFAVSGRADEPLVDAVTTAIADQQVLLVLDNCEQIVADVAALCTVLLERCPRLHVLATSRERLGVSGEVLYRVPSLSLPEKGAGVERALTCDAVRLFVDRARLVAPTFELANDNVDDTVSICRRLDGIPLALELAAARLVSMSPAQIVRRLDERFRLLTSNDRTKVGRQETLLSAIEWSHDLLDDGERAVFRRLGTFASDFSLEAAERVVTDDDIDELDVLDLVTSLVDKSMLTAEVGADGSTRYRLLETLREFARRRLDDEGERDEYGARHVDHYVGRAEHLQALHRSRRMGEALAGLELDDAEFRAALQFAFSTGRHVAMARLVGGLGFLWYAGGMHREGMEWCSHLFDHEPELPDDVLAGALHSYASLLGVTGRANDAIDVAYRQITIRRRLGDPARLGAALNNLGNFLCDVGRFEEAEPVLAEATPLIVDAGISAALPLSTLGDGRANQGRYDEALVDFDDAVRAAEADGDAHALAVAISGRGRTLAVSGHHDEARSQLLDARERFEELKVVPGVVDADIWLAVAERSAGRLDVARERLACALTSPDEHWFAEAGWWMAQLVASVIDDHAAAAVLVGAVRAEYDRDGVTPSVFIATDLASTSATLEAAFDADELARHFRTGARRSRSEVIELARRSVADGRSAG